MTLGLAPGKLARTTTVGGTTSGYSLIGNWNSEMAPPMRITSDSTAAKIGRLMKNCEKFMAHSGVGRASGALADRSDWCGRRAGVQVSCGRCSAARTLSQAALDDLRFHRLADRTVLLAQGGQRLGVGHRHRFRLHRAARAHALQAVDHNAFALGQTAADDAQPFQLDRKSVVMGKSVSIRGALGVR